jgi:thiol-disulfide isomerase/thioredoxin
MLTAALLLALFAAPGYQGENQPVLLDFHSQNCGPCQQMRPAIEELVKKRYPVKSVDVAVYPQLAAKYHVEHVPTFIVVDSAGRQLARVEGARPAIELANMYRAARAKLPPEDESAEDEIPARKAAPAPAAADPLRDRDVDDDEDSKIPRPWETVVRICIPDGNRLGFGSGTIIYSTPEESIILTCAHIFKLERRKQVTAAEFPLKIQVDLFDGKIRSLKPAVVHHIESYPGQAVDYDFAADVGLVRIRPGKRLPASPVVPVNWKPSKSLEMIAVGCSQGHDATAWTTHINRAEAPFLDSSGKPYSAIECVTAPIQGRSGGGLYTTDGYVAGVCDFADYGKNLGLYASPKSIYKILDRNNLRLCYSTEPRPNRPGTLLASNRPGATNSGRSADALHYRSQDSDDSRPFPHPRMVGADLPGEPGDSNSTRGANLAWQGLGKSGSGRSEIESNAPRNPVTLAQQNPQRSVRARLQNSAPDDDPAQPESRRTNPDGTGPESAEMHVSAPYQDDTFDTANQPMPPPAKPMESKTKGLWRAAAKSTRVDPDL